jgi:serine/threonine-protein kinase
VTEGVSSSAAGVSEGDVLAGKYRVERVLGVGGMGVVIAAYHIQLNEKVAIKFLLPEALSDAAAVARFAREAQAAVKIKSEHVARVSDVGTLPNGAPYMVMEYLDGGDLAAWIEQRGALPVEQAVEFVLQACVAVADAHALGIVHRDLKPANLFCVRRSDGQLSIKVLDFGISKMADFTRTGSAVAMTRTSVVMGTPLYMSPEQMRSSKDVDAQTDIWALGAILFELIAGRTAFLAESVTELAIKVHSEATPSIRSFRPDVAIELEAVIGKCLEKERCRRYHDVGELARALLPFAPPRAKASVDRISGIIQAAGLSAGALATPPSQTDGAQGFPGTLPPVGRTTAGATRGRKVIVGAGVAGAIALMAVVGSVMVLKGGFVPTGRPRPASAETLSPPVTLPPPPPLAAPPTPAEAAPHYTPLVEVSAEPAGVVLQPAAWNSRKKAPADSSAPAATASHSAAAPKSATPSPAGCDPPYYFDAKGNRLFKPECL